MAKRIGKQRLFTSSSLFSLPPFLSFSRPCSFSLPHPRAHLHARAFSVCAYLAEGKRVDDKIGKLEGGRWLAHGLDGRRFFGQPNDRVVGAALPVGLVGLRLARVEVLNRKKERKKERKMTDGRFQGEK